MSNMTYCRFQNTSKDLQDCIDAVEQMINNDGCDEYNEHLSRDEKRAFEEMVEQARYFFETGEQLLDILEYNEQS